MSDLSHERCVKPQKGMPSLSKNEIDNLLPQAEGWMVLDSEEVPKLQKIFRFKRYKECLDFAVAVGLIADEQDHHPKIIIEYGKVTVEWWTHVVNGLHRNDFIMAAKTDQIYRSREDTKPRSY
ncbi:MAG: pterin-4-alpha-carbinolamine dehydratase [Bellilinea sp.]|nr:MAG: pterin-4-alpha-carbinolamine dehydratase [Bellilinea sp.]